MSPSPRAPAAEPPAREVNAASDAASAALPAPSWWRRRRRAVLTAVAAALVLGGLVRLVTDQRVVEVVSFQEP